MFAATINLYMVVAQRGDKKKHQNTNERSITSRRIPSVHDGLTE